VLESAIGRLAAIGSDPGDDEDARLSKALLVVIAVAILPIAAMWAVLYTTFAGPVGLSAVAYFVISLVSIAIFARTRNFGFLLRVQLLAILLAPTLSTIPLGGFLGSGGVGLWGVMAPLGALVFSDYRSAIRWFVAFLVAFLGSGIAGAVLGFVSPLPAWFLNLMIGLNIAVGGTIVFTLLALFAKQRRDALAELRVEQAKAENLLLNILPRSIAEKLKERPQTIADQFSEASILFADVVDFTPQTERKTPAELVGMLDQLFGHFDTLVEKYDLEKIKTIGDCYMAAAGIPTPRPDHAHALALLALDMLEAVGSSDAVGKLGLRLRIGINSGPVVAGVIGRKRFLYDLWGDAVNIASRMETHGTPDRIQVTESTYELLKADFDFEPRGPVEIKGKGSMDTWYLVRPRSQEATS
jgi:adenylate cyclase